MERQITLGACEDSMNFFRVTLVKATVGIHGPNEMKVGYILIVLARIQALP